MGYIWRAALVGVVALGVAGCLQTAGDVTSRDHPNASDAVRSIDLQPRFPQAASRGDGAGPSPTPATYYGSPVETTVREPTTPDATGGYTLNFENAPVSAVAQSVLGDILNVGYIIDPRAQGTICLSSSRPVAKKDVLFVLENALKANNLVLTREASGYRISPAGEGVVGAVGQSARLVEPAQAFGDKAGGDHQLPVPA